jgi:hypothetical protein
VHASTGSTSHVVFTPASQQKLDPLLSITDNSIQGAAIVIRFDASTSIAPPRTLAAEDIPFQQTVGRIAVTYSYSLVSWPCSRG